MSTALDTVISSIRATRVAKQKAYTDLVRILAADDVDLDPDEVVQVVEDAGKSFEQLDADTRRLSARLVAAATLALLPERERARAAAELQREREVMSANEACQKILAELDRKRAIALGERDDRIEQARELAGRSAALVNECEEAEALLTATAAEELRAKVESLRAEHHAAAERVHAARLRAQAAQQIITMWTERAAAEHRTRDELLEVRRNADLAIPRAKEDLARHEKELASARSQVADIEARLREAEATLLVP